MTSLGSLLQSAPSLPQRGIADTHWLPPRRPRPMISHPGRYALPWGCFDLSSQVRNQCSPFPGTPNAFSQNSAFISFLDHFRKGLVSWQPNALAKSLYFSLLFSTLLYLSLPYSLLRANFAILILQRGPSVFTGAAIYKQVSATRTAEFTRGVNLQTGVRYADR